MSTKAIGWTVAAIVIVLLGIWYLLSLSSTPVVQTMNLDNVTASTTMPDVPVATSTDATTTDKG